MSPTVIREAVLSDVDAIDQLLGELAEALGDEVSYIGDKDALELHGFGPQRLFHTLIAERDDVAVGLCIYFPEFSTWRGQPGVYVQDLIVTQAVRGENVGRRLLVAAMSDAMQRWSARYLRLAVGVDNQAGIDFYRRLGMVRDVDNVAMMLAGNAVSDLLDAAG